MTGSKGREDVPIGVGDRVVGIGGRVGTVESRQQGGWRVEWEDGTVTTCGEHMLTLAPPDRVTQAIIEEARENAAQRADQDRAGDVPIRVGDGVLRTQDAAMIRATLKRRLRRLTADQHYKWDDTTIYSIVRVLDLAAPDWREGMPNVAARLRNSRLHWHDGQSLGTRRMGAEASPPSGDLADREALDMIAAKLNEPGPWNGADVCELAAQVVSRTGRVIEDEPEN